MSSKVPLVLGSLVAAASLAGAVYAYDRLGSPDVRFGPIGFSVVSDELVRIQFEVRKEPAATAVCTVRARDESGAETGLALVRVGPAEDGTVRVTHELPTRTRANTGEVTGCSLDPSTAPSGTPSGAVDRP